MPITDKKITLNKKCDDCSNPAIVQWENPVSGSKHNLCVACLEEKEKQEDILYKDIIDEMSDDI